MLLILLVATALPASAQDPSQRIQAAIARAAAAGIPISLLESKIAEGRAKNVRPDVLATAIERREVGLLRAREAMSGASAVSPMDLGVGADALEAGIEPSVLQRLARAAPSEHRAVAIVALTELVNAGHPAERALQQVQDALRRGPAALSNLPGQAGGQGQGRGPPTEPPGRGRGQGAGQGGGPPAGGPPAGVNPGGQGQGPGGGGPPGQGGGGPPGQGGGGPPGQGGGGPPGQGGGGPPGQRN